jgi:hypothetical protein
LEAGMSIAVYDTINNRVDHVWSRADSGRASFTQYHYNYDSSGALVYTVTGSNRAEVTGLTGITVDTVATLTASDIDTLLGAGMSIAVYDTTNNRIDHVWSRSESGEASFTQYHYNSQGEIVYTVTGADRAQVENISGVNVTNVATLTEENIESILSSGMSIAVYDASNNRVDHVWSRNQDGDISYTRYNYDVVGRIVYTVTGSTRAAVENLSGVTVDTIATLSESEINGVLGADMSIAVYDTDANRIDFVWAKNDADELSFTQYNYDALGKLLYTLSGDTRGAVEGVSGIDAASVNTLTEENIQDLLSAGMSLAVYDTVNNRVDHVWSRSDAGKTTFTQYTYDSLGRLVYTVTAESRTAVESLAGINVSNAQTLTEADIDIYLGSGISIAVYDTVNNRVDHVWNRDASGSASFTKYFYNAIGKLAFTITGSTRSDVEAVETISAETVATLSESAVEAALASGMSLAVYDISENRVDHIWSRSDDGTISFARYFYDADGALSYTITGESRSAVAEVTGITTTNVSTLTTADIQTLLSPGMSLAVYDIANDRIDYVLARNKNGETSCVKYFYDASGVLAYTLSASTRNEIEAVTGIGLNNFATLTETEVESHLSDGMSLAVYDTTNNRVAHVWSITDGATASFTLYHYDDLGKLVFTVTGQSRSAVLGLSDITVSNAATLTDAQVDSYLSSGLSIAVYDTVNNRVDHVWSRSDSGDASFTQYSYNALGQLIYTVSDSTRAAVDAVTEVTMSNYATLSEENIKDYLNAGMSIAVYDVDANNIDYVWSLSDDSTVSYTKYNYDTDGRLVFTVTGENRSDVEGLTEVTLSNVASLSEAQIGLYLSASMSLAVYDSVNGRIDHVWSKDKTGELSFTKYHYNADGLLVYTVNGGNKTQVEGLSGVTINTVADLSESDIDGILAAGMSIAVYDLVNNRVDHVWSRSKSGDASFTQYTYDAMGKLIYTVTGANRSAVETLGGMSALEVDGLTELQAEGYLSAGMSLAVYDTVNNRIGHVWSMNETGDISFTGYYYNDESVLVYTVTGKTRASVVGLSQITVENVTTLTASDIDSALSAGMSVSVYDSVNNRVDHVWSRSDSGEASFTQYNYRADGTLIYTVTGADRVGVESLSGITVENVATLSTETIEAVLGAGMSIAVYDTAEERIDHVWSRGDSGDIGFTTYHYDGLGKLVYTISGSNRAEVTGITGLDVTTIATLTQIQVDSILSAGMSIAVYDTVNNRVAHVWSRSDAGDISFTRYTYDENGMLSFTLTGEDRTSVESVTGITALNVGTLSAGELEASLLTSMSLSVYDTGNNRIDHVWSKNEYSDISFTAYNYDGLGKLVYTITGKTRTSVSSVSGLSSDTVADLTEADIDSILPAGMSIAVYDTVNNRVDHIWSRDDSGKASFAKYHYSTQGKLAFTITAASRSEVEAVTGLSADTIFTIDEVSMNTLVASGMSVAVYDTGNNRIDHVWSRSDEGKLTFTKYRYDALGRLVFTLTGDTRSAVESVSTITVDNAPTLTTIQVESMVPSGMTLSVYDALNNRVDHVWSRDAEGEISFTQYNYDADGVLVYTISGRTRSEVASISGITLSTVATLTETDIVSTLGNGMSIAVYDTTENRVDHVWSRGESGEVHITTYYYDGLGKLVYTLTGTNRASVTGLSAITVDNVESLSESAIASALGNNVTLSVYDTINSRIDHVWSSDESGTIAFTKYHYHYDQSGALVYTVTGENRAQVTGLSGVSVDTVRSLTAADIDGILSAGMSIAVYDTDHNRVDHIWSRDNSGKATFTKYFYDTAGVLVYTITGSDKVSVESVSGISVATVETLSTTVIESALSAGMSLSVYDVDTKRVDHSWARSDGGEISFTKYHYNELGRLVYTVSGDDRAQIEGLTGVDATSVGSLTREDVDSLLLNGMNIAVYDVANNRIDHIWSRNRSDEITFTRYSYNSSDALVYTITGQSRTAVDAVSGINTTNVSTLDEVTIQDVLSDGMSIAVYDIDHNRVSHTWSRSASGDVSFTEYYYDGLGKLVFTVTAAARSVVEGLTGVTVSNAASLSESDIDTYLSAGMSIAVYDTINNRVDHIWARSASGEASFTKYHYTADGQLTFTLTGASRSAVENTTGITPANAASLTDAEANSLIGSGMSLTVYDLDFDRVGHVWSRDDNGKTTFTQYYYNANGDIAYTLTGAVRNSVESLTVITVANVSSLTAAQVDSYLISGMTLSVYDVSHSRVDYIWSKDAYGKISFTEYFYDESGAIAYTISGDTKTAVSSVTGITLANVGSLNENDILSALGNGMSIAIYDSQNNRIDHVWSRSDRGDTSFTAYTYDSLGKLVYTVSGATRTAVENVTGITVDTVATLDETAIDSLLSAGMSISVYDTVNSRVDHVWSRDEAGKATYTRYFYHYDVTGVLVYTVTGATRSSVDTLTGITVDTVRTLSAADIDAHLAAGMSIAVYDTDYNRIDHVWSRDDTGKASFTKYSYNSDGEIVFTISGSDRTQVESITTVTNSTVATLSESFVEGILSAGMSLSVYDTANARVDHVWSRSDNGDINFTKYFYNTESELVYTVTGATRAQVNGITGIDTTNAASLTNANAGSILDEGMSIAVYDISNNRIDHVWSRSESGEIAFTKYRYDTLGKLVFTLSGEDRTQVEDVTAITAANVATLTEAAVASYLNAGMSVSVYDTVNNRVDHTWNVDAVGAVSFTQYHYDVLGKLVYTVTGKTRDAVTNISGITLDTVSSLTAADIDAYLGAGMSLVVYDTVNSRVDHVWNRDDSGKASYTRHFYNAAGELVYTLSGASSTEVNSVSGITLANVGSLLAADIDSLLSSGMSLSVYDLANNRVDHVWARGETGDVSFTAYTYNVNGDIVYTISGASRSAVESVTGITISNVSTLDVTDIENILEPGMSLAVYDIAAARVDHVWSRDDSGRTSFTRYFYNAANKLAYTVSGPDRATVNSVSGITTSNVTTLTTAEVKSMIAAGMSIAVYDTVENRIAHVWNKSELGDVNYTKYYYDSLGKLVFTVSADTRTAVDSLSTITTANVLTLTDAQVNAYISERMSVSVYDTVNSRVAYVWSKDESAQVSYTKYFYNTNGNLAYTITGKTRAGVDGITTITAANVATLSESTIDSILAAGMSIAVYDIANNRVDHVWSRSDSGVPSFTKYFYTDTGRLAYTITGTTRASVVSISGITVTNVNTLSESAVAAYLSAGMSISVYDMDNNRVDHVWSKSDSGELTFTEYIYDADGTLVYTVSGATRGQVTGLTGVTLANVRTLTEANIQSYLSAGMSIAVYAEDYTRVDHVWSRDDYGTIAYTKYFYTATGALAYTISADTRALAEGVSGITVSNVASLTPADISTYLSSGMSLAVYDPANNRVDHVWSRSDSGDTTFTRYNYDTLGKLVFTISGSTRVEVDAVTQITVSTVATLSESDIDAWLSAGMSVAVYDTINNRVDHIWSRDDTGKASYTQYFYNGTGLLAYTITSSTRAEVLGVTGIDASSVGTLSLATVDGLLSAGMSIAVYDTTSNRVDHTWSRSDSGAINFTTYHYNSGGQLVYTVSGEDRTGVENLSGVTVDTVATLSEADVDSYLASGMSISVYDLASNRVDHVWSRDTEGALSFTHYRYNSDGELVFTISGASRSQVMGVTAITVSNVATLTQSQANSYILAGMSIAVYSVGDNRVDYVWSKSDSGSISFVKYHYDALGKLVYTVSGTDRVSVEALTGVTVDTVSTLSETQIDDNLGAGMSIAVYDTINNRIDHVWSRDAAGEASFTKYYYNAAGALVYTVSAPTRDLAEGLTSVTVSNVDSLTDTQIDSILSAGMSIVVYDALSSKVDHAWSRDDAGKVSFTKYFYNTSGELMYTITGSMKTQVLSVTGITEANVATLTETEAGAFLQAGMSIAVYDTDHARVDHVWNRSDSGELSFAQYFYNAEDNLAYTLSATSRTQVEAVSGISTSNVSSLSYTQIQSELSTGMSLSVYDVSENRVDHSWSRSESGETSFTKYKYDTSGKLVFTISGENRTQVEGISEITPATVSTLTQADAESYITNGVTIAVYDTINNRVDHIWSRSETGEMTFTSYNYDDLGKLVFTVSGATRDDVEGITGLTTTNVYSLTISDAEAYLSAGMSIAVYDTISNRVDVVWNKNKDEVVSVTKYNYNTNGDLVFTVTGGSLSEVTSLAGITVDTVWTVSEATIDAALADGVSLTVYDVDTNRVDHVWSKSDRGERSFTKYNYDGTGTLVFTLSAATRDAVMAVTQITTANVRSLNASQIGLYLTNNMTLTVYDANGERIDYVWAKDDDAKVTCTQYFYDANGKIVYTLTGTSRTQVQSISAITVDNVRTLTSAQIQSYLQVGMTLSVYADGGSRVEYVLSIDENNKITKSIYHYVSGTDDIEYIEQRDLTNGQDKLIGLVYYESYTDANGRAKTRTDYMLSMSIDDDGNEIWTCTDHVYESGNLSADSDRVDIYT